MFKNSFITRYKIICTIKFSPVSRDTLSMTLEVVRDWRLNTGYPIFLSGTPTYFVFVITPTATIYSQVDKVLFSQRIETFSLLVGATVAIVVLIIFLIKWSSLSE